MSTFTTVALCAAALVVLVVVCMYFTNSTTSVQSLGGAQATQSTSGGTQAQKTVGAQVNYTQSAPSSQTGLEVLFTHGQSTAPQAAPVVQPQPMLTPFAPSAVMAPTMPIMPTF